MTGQAMPDHLATHPPARAPAAAPRAWRDVWAIEQHAGLLAFVQTGIGRLALVAAFAAAAPLLTLSWPYVLAAAAFAYWPAYRNLIAWGAALVAIARSTDVWLGLLAPVLAQESLSHSTGKAVVLAVLAGYFLVVAWALRWARQQPSLWLARRPVQSQLGISLALAAMASLPALYGTLRLVLWTLLCVVTAYLWFVAYALQDQRSRAAGPLILQLGILHPMWRSSAGAWGATPLGKGAAFLRRHQAVNDQELAVTQLKALKLLVWAGLLMAVYQGLTHVLHQRLGWVRPAEAYAAFLQGQPLPLLANWAALLSGAMAKALTLAIWGHKIVAVARLAGYRLPRNTWRPLGARTLAEFWNRYYYYFKELLVEFFFFPTFLRVFRQHPRLRVFFATFMAAGVGNAIYHALAGVHWAASMGWRAAATSYASYLFYCLVLASAIGVSQARLTAGRQLPSSLAGRLWCGLCVWGFFVVLQVFGDEGQDFDFTDRLRFLGRLFGV